MDKVVTTRRNKLRHVIDTQYGGSLKAFVDKTGTNPSELSGLLRNKSFGEKKARHIESIAGLPPMYLDTPPEVSLLMQEIYQLVASMPESEQEMVLAFCRMAAKKNRTRCSKEKKDFTEQEDCPSPVPAEQETGERRGTQRRQEARIGHVPEQRKLPDRRTPHMSAVNR